MKKIIYIFVFVFFINFVSAFDIELGIKDSFTINEKIYFDYTIISDMNQTIIYVPHIQCPNAPISFLQERTINLIANQPFSDIYYDINIDDSIEPQICTAYIQILEPIRQEVKKAFEIKTNPSFRFEILFDKKIFVKDEEIMINYNSEIENPEIKATLIYPNKKIEKINLPYIFKAEQIGTYSLDVTASKDGYKTIIKKEQFGVIEKEVNIPYTDLSKIKVEEKKGNYILYIGIIILIGLIMFIINYFKNKNIKNKRY